MVRRNGWVGRITDYAETSIVYLVETVKITVRVAY
jgi:hypothetical protein